MSIEYKTDENGNVIGTIRTGLNDKTKQLLGIGNYVVRAEYEAEARDDNEYAAKILTPEGGLFWVSCYDETEFSLKEGQRYKVTLTIEEIGNGQ